MKLFQHKILITGGNKGIGLALAKKMLSLGNEVIITGRNQSDLDQIKKAYPAIDIIQGDLTVPQDMDRLIHYIEQEHSDLNILINNAGIQYNYDLLTDHDVVNKINAEIKTNLTAPILLTAHLLPILSQNPHSAIVNLSSALGFVPKRSAPIYGATKAGIHNFSKALRYQLDGGVKVFEVIPPLVDTAMTAGRGKQKISPEQLVEHFIKAFKKDRFEINIGKVGLLRMIQRISPALAARILKDQ